MEDIQDEPSDRSDPMENDLFLLKNRALNVASEGITIADMRLPDEPLIYINEGFERLTGYSAESMAGKNCRFLQGKDTDPETVRQIREALASGTECTVEILNYSKKGDRFWNRLSLTPITDSTGEVSHFIGVQSDITKRRNAEEALLKANRQLEIINKRMTKDLEAAGVIQRSLLPSSKPRTENVRFAWVYEPCDELGGDTLNVFRLDENRLAVYMVDVSGHGVRASLLSFTLSHWFSRLQQGSVTPVSTFERDTGFSFSPESVAEELNRQFQMDTDNPQYFTMIYGIIDEEAGEFRFVTAGNPPIVVARNDGNTEVLTIEGFPIGIVEKPEYSENAIKLNPGDRVFLYTDGLTEAEDKNGNPYGTDQLSTGISEGRLLDLNDCLGSIMKSVKTWDDDRGLQDDLSILAFEILERK